MYGDGVWIAQLCECNRFMIIYAARSIRHYSDVIMSILITGGSVVYSIVRDTGEFPTQQASIAENISIWWRHHEMGT